jgi:hypothetical protein
MPRVTNEFRRPESWDSVTRAKAIADGQVAEGNSKLVLVAVPEFCQAIPHARVPAHARDPVDEIVRLDDEGLPQLEAHQRISERHSRSLRRMRSPRPTPLSIGGDRD